VTRIPGCFISNHLIEALPSRDIRCGTGLLLLRRAAQQDAQGH
jgi:hypothetical protein